MATIESLGNGFVLCKQMGFEAILDAEGRVNITKIAKAYNESNRVNASKKKKPVKKAFNWIAGDYGKDLVELIEKTHGVNAVIVPKGLPNHLRGTYVHPDMVIPFAVWLDKDYCLKLGSIMRSIDKLRDDLRKHEFEYTERKQFKRLINGMGMLDLSLYDGRDVCYIVFLGEIDGVFMCKFGHSKGVVNRAEEHSDRFNCEAKLVAVCKTMTAVTAETMFGRSLRKQGMLHRYMKSKETFKTSATNDIRWAVCELNRVCNAEISASESERLIAELTAKLEESRSTNKMLLKSITGK